MIRFQGKYLLFPSMTAGFLYSEDLAHWEFQPTEHLPIYDYAPDVRAAGEYLYFCASSHEGGRFLPHKGIPLAMSTSGLRSVSLLGSGPVCG